MSSSKASALFAQAVSLQQQGQFNQAESLARRILEVEHGHADANHLLGAILASRQQYEQADAFFLTAIKSNPRNPLYRFNQGVALKHLDRLHEAMEALEHAVRLAPEYAQAYSVMGKILMEQGRTDESLDRYRQALKINPTMVWAHYNRGILLADTGDLETALSAFDEAIALDEQIYEIHHARSVVLKRMARFTDALHATERVLALNPELPIVHFERGYLLLLAGDFAEGWREYEWRRHTEEYRVDNKCLDSPQWGGERLDGKTILLVAEQGFGDTIQFIRYAPVIASMGGRVIVECQAGVKRLVENMDSVAEVYVTGSAIPDYDVHASLMSLPGIVGTRLENIPENVPYLSCERLTASRRSQLGFKAGRHNIGFVWAGRPAHKDDKNRSVSLSEFEPLLEVEGLNWFSLQVGDCAADLDSSPLYGDIKDVGSEVDDFYDTASVIQDLDLLITVDTAVAHLAGALGRPVWVVLPLVPDFRWMLEREDSPWYPTIRLFRQSERGIWSDVFERLQAALEGLSARTNTVNE